MDWQDRGIVLSRRRHGESAAVVTLMTRDHGRHPGLVRGGAGKRLRGVFEPGNVVHASWRARLADHLGTYTCELSEGRAGGFLAHADRLAALTAACSLTEVALPEREPHPAVFEALLALMDALETDAWASAYVKWELGLLSELGFGLDLECCVATGETENLIFVSPKSGAAVSAAAGEPYKGKLLSLPGFLRRPGAYGDAQEVLDGLHLTGFFLDRHVLAGRRNGLPARDRLVTRLRPPRAPRGDGFSQQNGALTGPD